MSRQALQSTLMLRNAEHFRKPYLLPTIAAGYLEMTVPAQATSRLQRYRITDKGRS
ncbi:Fic family protein [Janthinobacterium sp. CG_23.3]|uniref:Fic family protein n=1 Tax=Janthinobacterium sp. CG_23.3 TaxID=3349634 RepID=UPI0038D474D1